MFDSPPYALDPLAMIPYFAGFVIGYITEWYTLRSIRREISLKEKKIKEMINRIK